MPMEEKRMQHSMQLEDRARLILTGVEDVESFDEQGMVIETALGAVLVGGSELRIQRYNVDSGELCIEGNIDELVYQDATGTKKGLLGRLFG